MAFKFCGSLVNQYHTQGYVVFRGIVPPKLLHELRVVADQARQMAQGANRQSQRIQPMDRYAEQLDLRPFKAYCELSELHDAVASVLGPGYTHGHTHLMGILTEPADRPWSIGWHRDGVVEVPPEAYNEEMHACLEEVLHDLTHWNQVNCALYHDACTWYVPGSHRRLFDVEGEVQHTGNRDILGKADAMTEGEAERYLLSLCQDFPGAVQVQLAPGDFMMYRNLAWHNGNYTPYARRATIHDAVLCQHATPDWGPRWQAIKRRAIEQAAAPPASPA